MVGGVFCVLGEMMKQTMITYFGLSKKDSLLYVTIELVLLSVILTGFNLYKDIKYSLRERPVKIREEH